MKSPYISKVRIKNYRNFKDVTVDLSHKQVIVGENNVGKTNFIRAIQLILDRSFSDIDRNLDVCDFHDSIEAPKENGEEIEIIVEIQNYEYNSQLVAQFRDAVVSSEPPTIRFTYRYYPIKDENGIILKYQYSIYKGATDLNHFRSEDREFINIQVIGALRDVERELNSRKRSPLYTLVKQYDISKQEMNEISEEMQEAADEILELDEIKDIKKIIENKFSTLTGLQYDNEIDLSPYDIDTERLLYTIQVFMGLKKRPVSELSLGLANILYVALMMIIIKDKTVPRILKKEAYNELITKHNGQVIVANYQISSRGINYLQKDDLDATIRKELYEFFDKNTYQLHKATFLAVEEPEAHLHPLLQRLIYKEVLHKSETSVLFTSHSPYITAVAPIETIVHFRNNGVSSQIFSALNMGLSDIEKVDIERYLDAKRGEIYFGKGVLLVEGITEEYIVKRAAELMNLPLDEMGVIICNVHSTNFKPYAQILNKLNIPWCLITDGDYYELETKTVSGKEKKIKHYHRNWVEGTPQNFRGIELMNKMIVDIELCKNEDIPTHDFNQSLKFLSENGCFVGFYTFEIDSMMAGADESKRIYKTVYSQVKPGGKKQQQNFDDKLDGNDFWGALSKIEANVSKGRFAQRLSAELTLDLVPKYIKDALTEIAKKVKV